MSTTQVPLSELAAVFRGIKAGHHWCFGDPQFAELNERFDEYRAFFEQLELTLHRDSRGFIYATSDDDDYKGTDQITRFVVFTSVWVDAVADEGDDIGARLFTEHQHVSDLPHLNGEAHRRLLAQVGVLAAEDLLGVLKSMERLGLVELDNQARFSLRAAFHRLLDVCLDAGCRTNGTTDGRTTEATAVPLDEAAGA